mmetsp:Transcript_24693/g.30365  ORF Transcript_24693/g.30365 Transcript_24693/m.30365 type:complete len:126 (+) Transcript_24693:64-441(+)
MSESKETTDTKEEVVNAETIDKITEEITTDCCADTNAECSASTEDANVAIEVSSDADAKTEEKLESSSGDKREANDETPEGSEEPESKKKKEEDSSNEQVEVPAISEKIVDVTATTETTTEAAAQ